MSASYHITKSKESEVFLCSCGALVSVSPDELTEEKSRYVIGFDLTGWKTAQVVCCPACGKKNTVSHEVSY